MGNFKSLARFLQYNKFQPCCSLGSHYLEIRNAVPLFSSQRKQGIPQLQFMLATWVLSNSKVTTSECCLISAPLVPYFRAIFYQCLTASGLQCNRKWTLNRCSFSALPEELSQSHLFNSPISMASESLKCHKYIMGIRNDSISRA